MKSKRLLAHIFLFGAALIYGANYSIAKILLDDGYIEPMGLVLYRVVAAALLFSVFHFIFVREKIDFKDLPYLTMLALFGVVINQSFFITGLKYTVPVNAALILTMVPVMVMVFSVFLLKEKIDGVKITGVLLGMAGVTMIILYKGKIQFNLSNIKGDLFMFFNTVSYSLYLVKVKKILLKYHPVTVIKWVFLLALLFIVPLGYKEAVAVDFSRFDTEIWGAFIYVLVFTTFLAYLFNILALQNVSASVAGIYVYLQPVLATIVALLLGKDTLTTEKIIAAVLIFASLYLVSCQNCFFSKKIKKDTLQR